MKKRHAVGMIFALTAGSVQAELITASDLGYGISGRRSNTFAFDFTGQPVWTAGSQRSDNGNADAGNQRAGRVFVEFQLTAGVIAAAAGPGSSATLFGVVDSIGQGVSGTPYVDGLDLRFLGVSGADRTPNTLWNTAGVGGDQADIVGVSDPAGGFGVGLANPNVLTVIAGASAGDFIAFGLSNSTGVDLGAPVGNSTAETYGFQLNQTLARWQLDVSAIPEPTTAVLFLVGLVGLGRLRR